MRSSLMDEHVQNPALAELETQKESQTPESAPIETKKTVESTKEYNLIVTGKLNQRFLFISDIF